MSTDNGKKTSRTYDVIICGGGLAAQTLARQLKLNMPDISVLMIAKNGFPLAWNDFKVGESTVEISSFYLGEVLQLQTYLNNNHFIKFGLRYFIGDTKGCISRRPEIGLTRYAPYNSFQIDRSILENDLYRMNLQSGVEIVPNATVQTISINEPGEPHLVSYQCGAGQTTTAAAKWVADASGRRCLLQRQLGLQQRASYSHSAAWWRVKGRLDIDNMADAKDSGFHLRVPYGSRYFSTTHLMGEGYWVWLIPLASGNTSIGIVTADSIHPFESYNTMEKALAWLQEHEPVLSGHLQGYEVLDFLKMKNYSYSSTQVFSSNRWACVGDAGVFTDPFYSPGSNFIAFENSMVTEMVRADLRTSTNWTEWVDEYNSFIIGMNKWLTESIQSSYTYFHLDMLMALSYIWDVAAGWSFIGPKMFGAVFHNRERHAALKEISLRFFALAYTVERFFNEWKHLTGNAYTFDFIDYLSIPFLKNIYDRNIRKKEITDELKAAHVQNLRDLEALVQAIFWLALEDVHPGKKTLIEKRPWINAWAITLDEAQWHSKGLFSPDTTPGDITTIMEQLKPLFRRKDDHSKKEDALDFGF